MIPAQFDYVEATSVADAIRLLAEHGDEAKLLAGGHSLIPLMKLRLVTPATLIDVTHIKELSYIKEDGNNIVIGALTRHRDIEESDLVKKHLPLVAHVAGEVGDPGRHNHQRHDGCRKIDHVPERRGQLSGPPTGARLKSLGPVSSR